MDKYMTIFAEEVNVSFMAERCFPDKKNDISRWLKLKFKFGKNMKKRMEEMSTVRCTAKVECV